ncbi:MAG: glycosyltransferase [Synergistaceae bacterium]|nr:glycosyltransferase [Synergistaceae bacterium]
MRILNFVDSDELSFRIPWLNLIHELERRGTEQAMLCWPGGNMERAAAEQGVPVHTWRPFTSKVPALCLGYPRLVRSISPDIVLTKLSSAAAIAGFWGRRLGIPTIATFDKEAKVKYYRNADHYISCSKWIRDLMVSAGIPPDRIDVVHNSVDVGRYRRDDAAGKKLRESLGIGGNERVFAGVGRFDAEKSFDVLIRAFSEVAAVRPDVRLMLVGDGPLRGDYVRQVDALGLARLVVMSDGFVDDVRPWLWGADYYVMPSRMEPFGIAMLEAMASGLPAIASDSGGLREILTDGENGFMARPGDPSSFAEAMIRVLDMDGDYIGGIVSCSLQRLSYFTSEALASRLTDVFERVLGRLQ